MASDQQRCGDCRWWKLRCKLNQLGDCTHPIPECVPEEQLDTDSMCADDGKTCRGFEGKETEREANSAVAELVELLRESRAIVGYLSDLMTESRGVCGFHLNGDDEPWGGFEELSETGSVLDKIDAAIAKHGGNA